MAEKIGKKAKNLQKLKALGFNVPVFFTVPVTISRNELIQKVNGFFKPTDLLAVRSSAGLEDKEDKSYAGFFTTEIGVEQKHLWKSFAKVRDELEDVPGSTVIIQHFIPTHYAGVCFMDVELNQSVVNALPGLCKAVVDGWPCEHYELIGNSISLQKIKPEYKVLQYQNDKIIEQVLKVKAQESRILRVQLAVEKICKAYKAPQDVEWGFFNDRLYIFQTRPVTRSIWQNNRETMLFDSANVGESYSGILSPLTATFAANVYKTVYWDLLYHSGVPPFKLRKHKRVFTKLVDVIYGRMFYRMDNWHRMMAFLPGYKANKRNLENMLNLNISESINVDVYKPSLELRLLYYPIVLNKFLKFDLKIGEFRNELGSLFKYYSELKIDDYTAIACQQELKNLINNTLRKWYLTVENDTVMMTLLSTLTKNKEQEDTASLFEFHSVSIDQLKALTELAKKLCNKQVLKEALVQKNKTLFFDQLNNHPQLLSSYHQYLANYGGRFANELKLETPDIASDFDHFSQLVLQFENKEIPTQFNKKPAGTFFERMFKKFASRREEFRLYRANMFGIIRKLVIQLGINWVKEGKLAHVNDVFYLHWEELFEPKPDQSIIAQRKLDEVFYKKLSLPAFFKVENNEWNFAELTKQTDSHKAMGASKGQVSGRVLVMEHFEVPEPDSFDILITKRTDPGWTSVMAMAKGIVVEHGGMLSHASIVARELGIPAVIGVENACKNFQTGDTILVDGTKGNVVKL